MNEDVSPIKHGDFPVVIFFFASRKFHAAKVKRSRAPNPKRAVWVSKPTEQLQP